ncbi:hypothetical protein APX82_26870 [Escherichia coli]|nr:hypothetical protein APX82_26870 [Escherichia coli]
MDTLFQRGVDGIQVMKALLIFACLCRQQRCCQTAQFIGVLCGAKWHLNRSQSDIRIDHDLASISDHSLASQSITIWHASDH